MPVFLDFTVIVNQKELSIEGCLFSNIEPTNPVPRPITYQHTRLGASIPMHGCKYAHTHTVILRCEIVPIFPITKQLFFQTKTRQRICKNSEIDCTKHPSSSDHHKFRFRGNLKT